jgi:hypothetical protein
MVVDSHTPCPACPVQVRAIYEAAQVLIILSGHVVKGDVLSPGVERSLRDALETVRISLNHLQPFVDAHLANQDHALSVELVNARHPEARSGHG